ncbi:hypothetical protein B0G81_2175 [Paraburkholderia sp. BL6665CI2N2]|uniref:hypothetical protein n=1 Tax=Paraburkholderia sp. BL6665CI2N2 TaxID=1938806 RepID=UPI001065A34C|nr:hypothetical protein [Paraburkholderia sp. BL6665CI2N2]TDY21937.1 hypothetical protein B0G81_2175 [Paraburkholderia sp. BL6665CI2N2]
MVLVFICLDWIAPYDPAQAIGENELGVLKPADAREECISVLASCIDQFAGAYTVLATRRMMGRRLSGIQGTLGELTGKIRDSVNTVGDSAYELISDFLVASSFTTGQSFEWVAFVHTGEDFPQEHRHRIAEFSGHAERFASACGELTRRIARSGDSAFTEPTAQEMSALLGDRRTVDAIRKRMTRTRTYS